MSGRQLTAKCSRCAKCGKVATAKCAHGGLVFHFCSKACSDQLCSVLRTGPPIGGEDADPLSGVLRELGAEQPPDGASATRLSVLPTELRLMVATDMPLLDVLRLQSVDQRTYGSLNDNSFWRQRAEKLSRTLRIPYTSPSVARLAEKYGWRWVVLNYFAQHDYIIETPGGGRRVVPVRRTFGGHKANDGRIVWFEIKGDFPRYHGELHNIDLLQDTAPQVYAALKGKGPYNTVFEFPGGELWRLARAPFSGGGSNSWLSPLVPTESSELPPTSVKFYPYEVGYSARVQEQPPRISLVDILSSDPSLPVLGVMRTSMGSTDYDDLALPLRDRNGEYVLSVDVYGFADDYLSLDCSASYDTRSARPPRPERLFPTPSMEDPHASGFISFSLASTDVLRELPTLPRYDWVRNEVASLHRAVGSSGGWKSAVEDFAGLCGDRPLADLAPVGQREEARALDAAIARLRGRQKVELRIPFDASYAVEQRRKRDEGMDPITTSNTVTLKMKALMSLPFVDGSSPHSSGPLTVKFIALLLLEETEIEIQPPAGARDGDEDLMDSFDFSISRASFEGFYLEGSGWQLVQSETSRSMPYIEMERPLREKAIAMYRDAHHADPPDHVVKFFISFVTPTRALPLSRIGRSVRVPSSHDTVGERRPKYEFLPLTPSVDHRVMIPTVAGGPDGIAKRLA